MSRTRNSNIILPGNNSNINVLKRNSRISLFNFNNLNKN
jgi:hypothetical protein